MSTLLDLLRESVLTQFVLTVVITLAVVYLYVSGQDVPETLAQVWLLVIGFYFGSKAQAIIDRRVGKGG